MANFVEVYKVEDAELPVPTIWREKIAEIVEAFKDGGFKLQNGISDVQQISEKDAKIIQGNIAAYGGEIISLPNESWDSSVCRWIGNFWDVLIDIYTNGEGRSDLVLFCRVLERGGKYMFIVDSVHVP